MTEAKELKVTFCSESFTARFAQALGFGVKAWSRAERAVVIHARSAAAAALVRLGFKPVNSSAQVGRASVLWAHPCGACAEVGAA